MAAWIVASTCGTIIVAAAPCATRPVTSTPAVGAGPQASGPAGSISVTPASPVTAGNRLVVLVGVWNSNSPTASRVTDSAGNTYVKLLQFKATDRTEMSVWSAPITLGGGTRPTITATPSGTADLGIQVLEYSGLSAVPDATVVDQLKTASGKTNSSPATVQSGATAPTTSGNELAGSNSTPGSATR